MDRRFPICLFLIIGTVLTISANTPESYLRQRWYSIELIVVEKVPPAFTPELVTNVVEKRLLPAGTIGMQLSDKELESIGELSDAVNFDAVVDEWFFDNPWHVEPTTSALSPLDQQVDEIPTTEAQYLDGCWMHLVNLEQEDTSGFESHDEWTQRIAGNSTKERSRDPRLPDWLPDVWQTFDQNLIDLVQALGLCDEDVAPLFNEEFLEFFREVALSDSDESSVEAQDKTLTPGMVHDAFDEYEHELNRTALTPQSNRLNLQQTANRLRNNGYRIIDHISWHQDSQARGTEPNVFVQFGQHFENGFREVEGTVAFSVARFLHLKVNLWRFVSRPQHYDPAVTEFESPLFFYEIQESRRIGLGEVHYFDHPKFGILVQIRRVPVPDDLEALVEQLNSTP